MDERETFEALVEIVRENDLDSLKLRVGETRFELIRREAQTGPAYPALVPMGTEFPPEGAAASPAATAS